MDMNAAAHQYLRALWQGHAIQGGFAWLDRLAPIAQDLSMESLQRIDALLDDLRATEAPSAESFWERQDRQTFLMGLTFYIGSTVAHQLGSKAQWFDYETFMATRPHMRAGWSYTLETSVACVIEAAPDPARDEFPKIVRNLFPMIAVVNRLYETPVQKSVHGVALSITRSWD